MDTRLVGPVDWVVKDGDTYVCRVYGKWMSMFEYAVRRRPITKDALDFVSRYLGLPKCEGSVSVYDIDGVDLFRDLVREGWEIPEREDLYYPRRYSGIWSVTEKLGPYVEECRVNGLEKMISLLMTRTHRIYGFCTDYRNQWYAVVGQTVLRKHCRRLHRRWDEFVASPLIIVCRPDVLGYSKEYHLRPQNDTRRFSNKIYDYRETSLHQAAREGNYQGLVRGLEHGVSVLGLDSSGKTPLHYAVRRGRYDCINFLLEHGADPNHPDRYGNTPVHEACKRGLLGHARILSRMGGDLTLENGAGNTGYWFLVNKSKNELGNQNLVSEMRSELHDYIRGLLIREIKKVRCMTHDFRQVWIQSWRRKYCHWVRIDGNKCYAGRQMVFFGQDSIKRNNRNRYVITLITGRNIDWEWINQWGFEVIKSLGTCNAGIVLPEYWPRERETDLLRTFMVLNYGEEIVRYVNVVTLILAGMRNRQLQLSRYLVGAVFSFI